MSQQMLRSLLFLIFISSSTLHLGCSGASTDNVPHWHGFGQLDLPTQKGLSKNPIVAAASNGDGVAVWEEISSNDFSPALGAPRVGIWASRYDALTGWQTAINLLPVGRAKGIDAILDCYAAAVNSNGDIIVTWIGTKGTFVSTYNKKSNQWSQAPQLMSATLSPGWIGASRDTVNNSNATTSQAIFASADAQNSFHVAWQDSQDGQNTLFSVSSSADGVTWTSTGGLSSITGSITLGQVVFSPKDGSVWYIWQDQSKQIYGSQGGDPGDVSSLQPTTRPIVALRAAIDQANTVSAYWLSELSSDTTDPNPAYSAINTTTQGGWNTGTWDVEPAPYLAAYGFALGMSRQGKAALEIWNTTVFSDNGTLTLLPLTAPAKPGKPVNLEPLIKLQYSEFSVFSAESSPGLLSLAVGDSGITAAIWSFVDEKGILRLLGNTSMGDIKGDNVFLSDPNAAGHAIAPSIASGSSAQFLAVWTATNGAPGMQTAAASEGHIYQNVFE